MKERRGEKSALPRTIVQQKQVDYKKRMEKKDKGKKGALTHA